MVESGASSSRRSAALSLSSSILLLCYSHLHAFTPSVATTHRRTRAAGAAAELRRLQLRPDGINEGDDFGEEAEERDAGLMDDTVFRLPSSPRPPAAGPLFSESSRPPSRQAAGPRTVAGVGSGGQSLLNFFTSPASFALGGVGIAAALVFQLFIALTGGAGFGDGVRYADEDDMPPDVVYSLPGEATGLDERPFDLFRMRRVDPE